MPGLLTRKQTLLAKIESVYGTDPTPTGSANAMLVKNLNVTPLSAELVSRDLLKPYLGNSENLIASRFVQLDFEVEVVASGVVAKLPAYDPLLRACGFVSSKTTGAITTITRSGTVATATRNAHGYQVGDKVAISGATQPEYNGEFTITARTTNTFDYTVTGTPVTPATGTPVVDLKRTYLPVSSGFESVTMYYNRDGVLHRATGARGSVELSINVKQIPVFRFTFIGLFNPVVDGAAPSVNYDAFMIPQVSNTQSVPSYSLYSYSGAGLESVNLNLTNDVQYITLIGSESVKILNRAPAGSIVLEAPLVAEKDYFGIASAQTPGAFSLVQDSRNGFKVALNCTNILLSNPNYQDSNGVTMLNIPFTAQPTSAGNDELSLEFS